MSLANGPSNMTLIPTSVILQVSSILLSKAYHEQDYIPVGCVPPACCPYLPACTMGGGVWGYLPLVWRVPPSGLEQGVCIPAWNGADPPLWTEWRTGAKILPCPKLRLREVKIIKNLSLYLHKCTFTMHRPKKSAISGYKRSKFSRQHSNGKPLL